MKEQAVVVLARGRRIRADPPDVRQPPQLFLARPDKTYSFTDYTSFALLRRLGFQDVAALDEDFRREGFALRDS